MRALKITNTITRRDERALKKYLNEISGFDVLTPEEELRLFEQFKNGDEEALLKIINHNLRFVVTVAKQYQFMGLWLGDLINEGNIGLIKAAYRFDVTKGFKFISYAVWWIRQSIMEAINNKARKIRLPQNRQSLFSKINEATVKFLQQKEREPSIDELAEETGLPEKVVQRCLENYKRCRSLDEPIEQGEDKSLVSFIEDSKIEKPDHKMVIRESQKEEVKYLLNKLSSREAVIISLYYGIDRKLPMTLSDISDYTGLSRERVRQVKDRGIRKLRTRFKHMQPTL